MTDDGDRMPRRCAVAHAHGAQRQRLLTVPMPSIQDSGNRAGLEEPGWLASGADARGVLVKITSPGPEREHGAQLRDDAGTLR
jgi:hypothetical protein